MQKIGNITNTADPQGEFTDGSVAQGISPTILLAAIFNTWQREMVGVVEGAGIALDSADDGQLLAAIKSLNKKSNEGFLLKGNNLSEIKLAGSIAQALTRGNIGLGTAAVANVGTGANQVPDMSSFANSLNANGYFKMPSGHLVQYFTGQFSNGGVANNFPIPFTSACFAVLATHFGQTPSGVGAVSTFNYTLTGFTGYTSGTSGASNARFIAIGI